MLEFFGILFLICLFVWAAPAIFVFLVVVFCLIMALIFWIKEFFQSITKGKSK